MNLPSWPSSKKREKCQSGASLPQANNSSLKKGSRTYERAGQVSKVFLNDSPAESWVCRSGLRES
jgi:hypothetical protein